MKSPLRLVAILLVVLGMGALIPAARAGENATIINASNQNVWYYLKWDHVNYESRLFVLAPGESHQLSGPDGAVLRIRFNSTPGVNPPREEFYKLITGNVGDPRHPGFKSYFRDRGQGQVGLYDR